MSTTRVVNTEQADAWNGDDGHHWATHQDRYDAMAGAFTEPLLTAAAVGERNDVLDIGCGNGQTTRLAARTVARGSAVGIDLSQPMLARARATAAAEQIANVTFVYGDAQVPPIPASGIRRGDQPVRDHVLRRSHRSVHQHRSRAAPRRPPDIRLLAGHVP